MMALVTGAILIAPSATWLLPPPYRSFDATLNLVWVSLAALAFASWLFRGRRHRRLDLPELLSLIFILALLFPIISTLDDLAQPQLANDAATSQKLIKDLNSVKHELVTAPNAQVPTAARPAYCAKILGTAERVVGAPQSVSVSSAHATGIHSPPNC